MSLNKKISIFRIWWEKSGKIFNASKSGQAYLRIQLS